ncbi:MAG TPA: hypothetical protein VF844_13110 [Ktedonobacteraceae bacterium]
MNGTSTYVPGNSELRDSATQQPEEAKSTREPARQAPTVASVTRQQ